MPWCVAALSSPLLFRCGLWMWWSAGGVGEINAANYDCLLVLAAACWVDNKKFPNLERMIVIAIISLLYYYYYSCCRRTPKLPHYGRSGVVSRAQFTIRSVVIDQRDEWNCSRKLVFIANGAPIQEEKSGLRLLFWQHMYIRPQVHFRCSHCIRLHWRASPRDERENAEPAVGALSMCWFVIELFIILCVVQIYGILKMKSSSSMHAPGNYHTFYYQTRINIYEYTMLLAEGYLNQYSFIKGTSHVEFPDYFNSKMKHHVLLQPIVWVITWV